jgi:hypothetical protein
LGFGGGLVAYHVAQSYRPIRADSFFTETSESPKQDSFESWKSNATREYENRLRAFSHPYKVFQYFATVVSFDGGWETFDWVATGRRKVHDGQGFHSVAFATESV